MKDKYLHISYRATDNNGQVGDGDCCVKVPALASCSMNDLRVLALNALKSNKPDVEWNAPVITSLNEISEDLFLKLCPEYQAQPKPKATKSRKPKGS